MKRSEMVSLIQFFLYDSVIDDDLSKLHRDAEVLLEKMEDAGMLPPEITVVMECNRGERKFKRNKWEEE